jgi:hypothetical protein
VCSTTPQVPAQPREKEHGIVKPLDMQGQDHRSS